VKIMTLRVNGIISPGISGRACRSELKPHRVGHSRDAARCQARARHMSVRRVTHGRPARSARSRSGLAVAGEDIKLTRPGKSHPIVMVPGLVTGPPGGG
jgi:hypothetical protein